MRREGGRTANQLQMSAAEREIKRVKDGERGGTEVGGGDEEVGGASVCGGGGWRWVRRFPAAFSTGSDNSFHLR